MAERSTFLEDVQDIISGVLQAQDVVGSEGRVIEVGQLIIGKIKGMYGGEPVYIKKKTDVSLEQRNAEIVASYDGKNHRELAKKHNLSKNHIYKIIKEHDKRQSDLFE